MALFIVFVLSSFFSAQCAMVLFKCCRGRKTTTKTLSFAHFFNLRIWSSLLLLLLIQLKVSSYYENSCKNKDNNNKNLAKRFTSGLRHAKLFYLCTIVNWSCGHSLFSLELAWKNYQMRQQKKNLRIHTS